MRKKTINNLLFFIFITVSMANAVMAQTAIGQWRDHFSYSNSLRVCEAEKKIYCSTDIGLFYYDKSNNNVEKLSKINGLSDLEISALRYSSENHYLFIAYSNANIDLLDMKENIIINISDIKRKQITGNKTINNILFIGHYAYLSCGFGIVVLDLEKKEIRDTYYIGTNGNKINVYDMTFDGAYLYAATETGIYKADINNPNLIDYNNWSLLSGINNYNKKFTHILWFGNKLYTSLYNESSDHDTLYVYEDNQWKYFTALGTRKHALNAVYDHLIVVSGQGIDIFDAGGTQTQQIHTYWGENGNPDSRDAFIDGERVVWIADVRRGMIRIKGSESFQCIYPNGPQYNSIVDLSVEDDVLWGAAGSQANPWGGKGAYTFIKETWSNIDKKNAPGLDSMPNISEVIVHPGDPSIAYGGSWGYGLAEFKSEELVAIYDETNSPLKTIEGFGKGYVRVSGLAFDNNSNLWIASSEVEDPIYVKKANGTIKNFKLSYTGFGFSQRNGNLIYTSSGHVWMYLHNNGLFVFDCNSTIDDETDDREAKVDIKDENNKIITNTVYNLAEDRDGAIWVGTNQGVLVYFSPENVFSGTSSYAQKIINVVDGDTAYLLETESVTAIVVDGANRKWIGTDNSGLYLVSEDGTKQIQYFNIDNSPLPSNKIICLSMNHKTGELFIGTDKGIVSYKSTSTLGDSDYAKILVYPNPVRENYTGVIAIRGLVTNANVKITDIAGNLVYETFAEGGQAIWDGKTFSGQRVQTGVYLIFCTNEDGSETYITKLLFIH